MNTPIVESIRLNGGHISRKDFSSKGPSTLATCPTCLENLLQTDLNNWKLGRKTLQNEYNCLH